MYGGRCANKESGKKTFQKNIPGIGYVKLVAENELDTRGMYEIYKMYNVDNRYLGDARKYPDGSWRFNNYPAIVIHEPINSPYAVNLAGC
jgi:hypothetical protein